MDETSRLLAEAAQGDRTALEGFVNRTQGDVRRFCVSMVGENHADDVTQETFVRAWRAAHAFRAEATARTWLLAIARRACADHHRRTRRSDTVRPARRATVDGPGETMALRDLIGRLDPDRRSAFVLTQLQGLSYQETAQICGCPVGTIRSRVARARTELLDAYQDDDSAADGRT